jgi:hypothetical protein
VDIVPCVGLVSSSKHAVSAVWATLERRGAVAVASGILECFSRGPALCVLRIGDGEIGGKWLVASDEWGGANGDRQKSRQVSAAPRQTTRGTQTVPTALCISGNPHPSQNPQRMGHPGNRRTRLIACGNYVNHEGEKYCEAEGVDDCYDD